MTPTKTQELAMTLQEMTYVELVDFAESISIWTSDDAGHPELSKHQVADLLADWANDNRPQ
ncbi:MAG: hypothetical protein ACPGOV_11780 [Magnetovibrionaceae bacterium]